MKLKLVSLLHSRNLVNSKENIKTLLRITNYELRITNYELRITNYELMFTIHYSLFTLPSQIHTKNFDYAI